MKTALFSVIHPGVTAYLDDFFISLVQQSYQNFDVIIVNDGVEDAHQLHNMYPTLSVTLLEYRDSIAKVREFGIGYLIEQNYDAVIFGDSDDWFSPNRVEHALKLLERYDIVINDVTLVTEDKALMQAYFFSRHLANRTSITLDMILEKNIFGLSNTALNLTQITPVTFDPSLIAVDWFFYTRLLLQGKTACFTTDTLTFYRQYAQNTVGLNKADATMLERGLQAKLQHYKQLAPCGAFFKEQFGYFKKIMASDDTKRAFFQFCQMRDKPDLWWWENIRSDFETD